MLARAWGRLIWNNFCCKNIRVMVIIIKEKRKKNTFHNFYDSPLSGTGKTGHLIKRKTTLRPHLC